MVKALRDSNLPKISAAYESYRTERTKIRELKSDLMTAISKIGVETDRDNANVGNNFSSKLLRIASESNKWHNLSVMPKELAKAHENGDIYWVIDAYTISSSCIAQYGEHPWIVFEGKSGNTIGNTSLITGKTITFNEDIYLIQVLKYLFRR